MEKGKYLLLLAEKDGNGKNYHAWDGKRVVWSKYADEGSLNMAVIGKRIYENTSAPSIFGYSELKKVFESENSIGRIRYIDNSLVSSVKNNIVFPLEKGSKPISFPGLEWIVDIAKLNGKMIARGAAEGNHVNRIYREGESKSLISMASFGSLASNKKSLFYNWGSDCTIINELCNDNFEVGFNEETRYMAIERNSIYCAGKYEGLKIVNIKERRFERRILEDLGKILSISVAPIASIRSLRNT